MKSSTDRDEFPRAPPFSPSRTSKDNMNIKRCDDGSVLSRNGSRYGYTRPKKEKSSTSFSLYNILMKGITLGMILLAVGVCYLSQLDAEGQQQCIQEVKTRISNLRDTSITLYDAIIAVDFKSHLQLLPSSSTVMIHTGTHHKMHTQISPGKELLQNHDPAGAEAMCHLATQQSPQDMEAWICLGEARLSLHNGAWESGFPTSESGEFECQVLETLNAARSNFETAVYLKDGAMSAEARLGLGLSLFLSASRMRRDVNCEDFQLNLEWDNRDSDLDSGSLSNLKSKSRSKSKRESTTQLIFDSILHLKAASSLTAPSVPLHQGGFESLEERGRIHMVANYNTALAYLALGDSSSAMSLLRNVFMSVAEYNDQLSSDSESNSNTASISIVELNLMAALVQKGSRKEATSIFNHVASKVCGRWELESHEYASGKEENKVRKLCTIAQNNVAIAREESGEDDIFGEDPYDPAMILEKELHVKNGFVALNGEQRNRNKFAVENNSIIAPNPEVIGDANTLGPPPASGIDVENDSYTQNAAPADIAGNETRQGPYWNSLSKARLQSGDNEGALEAGMMSLNLAMEEVNRAYSALEKDLEQNKINSVPVSASMDDYISEANAEKLLALNEEVMDLKLKLLRQTQPKSSGVNDEAKDDTPAALVLVDDDSERIATATESSTVDKTDIASLEVGAMDGNNVDVDNELTDSVDDDDREEISVGEELSEETAIPNDYTLSETNKENIEKGIEIEDPIKDEIVPLDIIESKQDDEENIDVKLSESPLDVPPGNGLNVTSQTLGMKMDDETDVAAQVIDEHSNAEEKPSESIAEDGDRLAGHEPDSSDAITEKESQVDSNIEIAEMPTTDDTNRMIDVVDSSEVEINATKKGLETMNVTDGIAESEESEVKAKIQLPELYNPTLVEAEEVTGAASSYMKMADAYLQKGNFKLSSKQFLKVLKKAPSHIPASLGYASSLERYASSKQLGDVVTAYLEVTKHALMQGNRNLAQATFNRALSVADDVENDRIGVLKSISDVAFSNAIAADTQYKIGMETLNKFSTDPSSENDSIAHFEMANEFMSKDMEGSDNFHPKSIVQLAKIALDYEGNAEKSLSLVTNALSAQLGEMTAQALIISARCKQKLGDVEGAIQDYKKSFISEDMNNAESSTASAHFNVALLMKQINMDQAEIKEHMEMALNLGMDSNVSTVH